MSHNQLTPKERYHIYQFFKQSCTVRVIARSLGRVSSTVSREIRRNGSMVGRPPHYLPASPNHYDDIQAQKKAKKRWICYWRTALRMMAACWMMKPLPAYPLFLPVFNHKLEG